MDNMVSVGQQTAVAPKTSQTEMMVNRQTQEVQGAIFMAKKFPRDEYEAVEKIRRSCQRATLAEQAIYSYPRGGQNVSGPSVRLAESLAQNWGNIDYGIIELEQKDGKSEMMAYAWDLETNTRVTKIFGVEHKRDTRNGSYALTDSRDIYEATANFGARRMRACILGVIPGDVVDMAVNECKETQKKSYGELPSQEKINKIEKLFKKDFGVTKDNDTRAMTYGEYMKGCVKGEKDIIFVNVSWGLGIGIIIDGKIYTGKSGFSGEFGHTNVFDNEIICHCGKKGCLETEASGSALHRILIERIQKGESSVLSNRILAKENPLTLDEIIATVNKEDPLCIEIVEEIGQKLGKQIAGLINIFNPELVIIGGTLSLTDDYITQPIKTAVRKYSLNLVNKDSAIATSKLKDKAGIIGACMLARSRMFES